MKKLSNVLKFGVRERKIKMNYFDKPLTRRCRECKNMELKNPQNIYGAMLCELGGFSVKLNAICNHFEPKGEVK